MSATDRRIDPRWRVLYLLAVAVLVFVLRAPWQLALALGVQVALWLAVGLPMERLGRQLVKLTPFALFVVASYALFADDSVANGWTAVSVAGLAIDVNVSGAQEGALMVVRVLGVVLASQVCRAGDPRAIAAGLAELRVPTVIAASLDVVLALLGDEGRSGSGTGQGGGRGRRRAQSGAGEESFWRSLARLARGDVAPIVERIERQIDRADRHAKTSMGGASVDLRRDVAVVAGISLTMLAIKMLKVLPSIPFAPGHKLVLLTPLYIVAAVMTRSRFGATLTGLVMGSVAFLMGDGRYGLFEIPKHVAPGLLCDLLVPLLVRAGRPRGTLWWALLGGVVAMGRFATIFVVMLAVQPPTMAYAFLAPGLSVHVFFGVASGWVSHHLVRAVRHFRKRDVDDDDEDGTRPSDERRDNDDDIAAE